RARKALLQVCGGAATGVDDYRVQLLADIQSVVGELGPEVVTSKSLIEKLNEMEDRPWPTFGKSGKGLTLKKLGEILKEFWIYSTQKWQGGKKIRGYPVAHFASAFAGYLGLEAVDAVEPASTLDEPNFSQSGMESL